MKKKLTVRMVVVVCLLIFMLAGCSTNGNVSMNENDFVYTPTITTPYENAVISDNDVSQAPDVQVTPSADETPATDPADESHPTDSATQSEAPLTRGEIYLAQREDTTLSLDDLVLSIPPTQAQINLPDGAVVPIIIHGNRLYHEQSPVMLGGEVFVPVFGVFERVNQTYPFTVTVSVDSQITIRNEHAIITLTEGETTLSSVFITHPGSSTITLEHPPQSINGILMLPLRPIIEAIGVELEWHEESGSVHLFTPAISISTAAGSVRQTFRSANPYISR